MKCYQVGAILSSKPLKFSLCKVNAEDDESAIVAARKDLESRGKLKPGQAVESYHVSELK